jgi:hypothetical protein
MPDAIEFIDNFNNRFGNTLFGVRSGGHFQCVHNLIITEYGCKLDKDRVLLEISVDAPDPLFWCEHVLTEEEMESEAWIDYDMFDINDDMRLNFYTSDMEPPTAKLVNDKFKAEILVAGGYGNYVRVTVEIDVSVPADTSNDVRKKYYITNQLGPQHALPQSIRVPDLDIVTKNNVNGVVGRFLKI